MNIRELVDALTSQATNSGAIHAIIKEEIATSPRDPEDICWDVCTAVSVYRGEMNRVIDASDDADDVRKAVNNAVGYCNSICKKDLGWGFKCTEKPSKKNPNKPYVYVPVEVQAKSEDSDISEPEVEIEEPVVVPKSCREQVEALVAEFGIREVGQAVADMIKEQADASK